MKILYLYSELVGYQIPVLIEYVNRYGAEVHVVSWDKNKLKPYEPPILDNITFYKRSQYSKQMLIKLASDISPDIVYISGWMDRDYLAVVRQFRKQGTPVVTGFDDQWNGSLRQKAATILFPLVRDRHYSHAWVAGPYQYEFARRLGFTQKKIIFNLLSCDTQLFSKGIEFLKLKAMNYPRSFLYVGNFRSVKGVDILIEAFKEYKLKYKGDWKLICVGTGDLQPLVKREEDVELLGFTSQNELVEISKRAGVFVLPSRHDQWGVVVHEFASAAMPLLLSENVGAKAMFFIESFNGISFHNNSSEDLAKAMHSFSVMGNADLIRMSHNSCLLSQRINPEITAASFMSIIQ